MLIQTVKRSGTGSKFQFEVHVVCSSKRTFIILPPRPTQSLFLAVAVFTWQQKVPSGLESLAIFRTTPPPRRERARRPSTAAPAHLARPRGAPLPRSLKAGRCRGRRYRPRRRPLLYLVKNSAKLLPAPAMPARRALSAGSCGGAGAAGAVPPWGRCSGALRRRLTS